MRHFYGDESGSLSNAKDNWFVLGGYHISDADLRNVLHRGWHAITRKYRVDPKREIKCTHLTRAYKLLNDGKALPNENPLQCLSLDQVKELSEDIIKLILKIDSLKIIVAACKPKQFTQLDWIQKADPEFWGDNKCRQDVRMVAALLQNLMQRFEFDLRVLNDEGVMHFDRLSDRDHETFIQHYYGRLVNDQRDHQIDYRKLTGSLSFDQTNTQRAQHMADIICGLCWGYLTKQPFHKRELIRLKKKIRCSPDGVIQGYGFVFVPHDLDDIPTFDDMGLE